MFCERVPKTGVLVRMGPVLDGVSEHMQDYPGRPPLRARRISRRPTREEVVAALRDSRADVLVNYLPVGSEQATRFYAECALEAGVAMVNCMPVFIASDPAMGGALRRARASRSSATTSRRSSAPPSPTAC